MLGFTGAITAVLGVVITVLIASSLVGTVVTSTNSFGYNGSAGATAISLNAGTLNIIGNLIPVIFIVGILLMTLSMTI